ncbi:hypothetical protein EX30DRAFT_258497 [Ascodesmis nigricans]|uniref:Uncharacterized protein n=1 Tax=Ascodesmis nigricans TaxID=341454 RepID=A0A4S2MHF4_9PEZI|nr:hypothetical protein EX30DRAFT_258497 [Ascodesmis nigricans]
MQYSRKTVQMEVMTRCSSKMLLSVLYCIVNPSFEAGVVPWCLPISEPSPVQLKPLKSLAICGPTL